MVADCSACTLTMSLPALMKSATLCSGSTIILQWTEEPLYSPISAPEPLQVVLLKHPIQCYDATSTPHSATPYVQQSMDTEHHRASGVREDCRPQ